MEVSVGEDNVEVVMENDLTNLIAIFEAQMTGLGAIMWNTFVAQEGSETDEDGVTTTIECSDTTPPYVMTTTTSGPITTEMEQEMITTTEINSTGTAIRIAMDTGTETDTFIILQKQ